MQECDVLAFGTESRLFVDEANARCSAPVEGGVEIVDDETDVMNARSSFGDELADG